MVRKGKRQMINNNITKNCIINAALTNNLSEKKKYLVMSGYSRSRFYEMVKNIKLMVNQFLITKERKTEMPLNMTALMMRLIF